MPKLFLIIEPIAVLLVIGFTVKLLLPFIGYDAAVLEAALFPTITAPDWLVAARLEGAWQLGRWVLLLLLAFFLARSRGFSPWSPVGDGRADHGSWKKLLIGLAAGAAILPVAVLPRWYHYKVEPIGEVPPIWDVIYASEWTPSFWLFMAVASFGLIPVVEELFFRGYVLGSLAKRFSHLAAVLLSALVFAAVHTRYAQPDAFALFNMISVFLFATLAAWLVCRTHSLLPAISMHVFVNVPRPLSWALYELWLVVPAALLVIVLLPARPPPARPRPE